MRAIIGHCTIARRETKRGMTMMGKLFTKRKTGFVLALGGGGGRGLAHLGVLDVLESHGLKPDSIVGSSIGSLFGALYALNPNSKECIERSKVCLQSELFNSLDLPVLDGEEVEDQSWLSRLAAAARQSILFTRVATGIAVADVNKLIDIINDFCQEKSFDDLKIPLYVVAVKFPSGECQIFSPKIDATLACAIAASMAIPGIFDPVAINGERFVDGSLAAELPAKEADMIAGPDQFVVAVNVGARPGSDEEPKNVIAMVDWATRIKSLYLRQYKKAYADVLIEPLVGFTQWHDFSNPDHEIEKGRQAALEQLPEIMKLLGR